MAPKDRIGRAAPHNESKGGAGLKALRPDTYKGSVCRDAHGLRGGTRRQER